MPKFLVDKQRKVHYTVIHLVGSDGFADSTVFLIKFKGVEWLMQQGARIGDYLPDGAFPILFYRQWLYPNKGLTPPEALVSSQTFRQDAPRPKLVRDKDGTAHFTGLRLRRMDGGTDSTVFVIKFQGAEWLKKRNVNVGQNLPDGVFRTLFERGWLYPD